MKKLLSILPVLLFSLFLNAQQTEDEVNLGKTFGKYRGPETRPIAGNISVTGIVINVQDSLTDGRGRFYSFNLKTNNGTIYTILTRDNGFSIPRGIEGHTIIVEGKEGGQVSGGRKRRDVAATGIKIIE